MWIDEITPEEVESILKSIAIVVGGTWVLWKFTIAREDHARIQFDIDLRVLGRQDGQILIEVIGILENKGLVRHKIWDLTLSILILKDSDKVTSGDEINNQVLFSKYNSSPKEDSKEKTNWFPKVWGYTFVDPAVKQAYTYLSAVPEDTTFISIHGKFHYKDKDEHTMQKTFSIKQLENAHLRAK